MINIIIKSIFLISSVSLASIISNIDIKTDVAQNKNTIISIEGYLKRYIGKEASEENLKSANNFLANMYFISKAECSYQNDNNGKTIFCSLISKRAIKNIKIVNLPSLLLEDDLKRKLPLQNGFSVDYDENFLSILLSIKLRVDNFLKKNGYYNASVEVKEVLYEEHPVMDIIITINNGFFVRVNKVLVTSDAPVKTKDVIRSYQSMCLSFSGLIESFAGLSNCFSREKERQTTLDLQEKLAKMGYIQSKIRISHHFILNEKSLPSYCQAKTDDNNISRCVNLHITIDKGPKFTWLIDVKDQETINRNAVVQFLTNIFPIDHLSRASIDNQSDENALDYDIIEQKLFNEVTFIEAKNLDENEISQSAFKIKQYLASLGYINAQVNYNVQQKNTDHFIIKFDVIAGKPKFIKNVVVLPDLYMNYLHELDLNNIIPTRSFSASGYMSSDKINEVKDKIEQHLQLKGFTDINISTDIRYNGNLEVDIVFYIKSSTRKLINKIIINNGVDEINKKIITSLSNCDNKDKNNHKYFEKLCHKSSFILAKIPEDINTLEEHYHSHGYLYAAAKVETVEEEDNSYNIIFTMYDNRYDTDKPLVRQDIKDIIISGNVATKHGVIDRLFPKNLQYSYLDPISLKIGLANLRESGQFSRIEDRKILAGQENSDDVYFLLHLTERPSMLLDTGIAFSTDQFFVFELELVESNFLSSLLKLNTSLGLGLFWGRQTIFNNKLIWPHVLGKPIRITINAPTIIYNDLMHRADPKRVLQSEISLGLDWQVNTKLTPYIKYGFFLKQYNTSTNITSFKERLTSLDGLIPTLQSPSTLRGILRLGISYISIDNLFNPFNGLEISWYSELSGGPLIGLVPFINLVSQNRFFISLGSITFAIQANVMRAFIDTKHFDELEYSSSMNRLGGDRSIRGYPEGYIGITNIHKTNNFFQGYFSGLTNLEMRFPLQKKDIGSNLFGALFVDQGILVPVSNSFIPDLSLAQIIGNNGLGLSLGAAIRYILPVGPISLEYGISPINGQNRFHVLFGYAF